MTIRVMLVDDQVLLRTGFRMVLAAQPDMEVVAEAGNGVEALEVLRTTAVDVVLMDVRMPKLDGVEATRRICADTDPPKVLILTTFDLDEYAFSGLKAGASGFMLKDVPPGELLTAIRAVHSGDAVVAPSTTRRLLDRFAPDAAQQRQAARAQGAGAAHRTRARGHGAGRAGPVQRGDRVPAGAVRGDREDARRPHPHQAGAADRVQVVVLAYETGLVLVGGHG
ncbi:DNA-binding NarL/FixJ family response regulator OS=Streptomyces albaduncus OX=68172 GN=FHS32_005342 PE=4 SV=1 [Streptomyces griseoloalbus]